MNKQLKDLRVALPYPSMPFAAVSRTLLVTLTVLCFLRPASVISGEIFFDDFSDGSVRNKVPIANDGRPVRWTTIAPGDYDASSGDYVLARMIDENWHRSYRRGALQRRTSTQVSELA